MLKLLAPLAAMLASFLAPLYATETDALRHPDPLVIRVLAPFDDHWCLSSIGNQVGVWYQGAPCQRIAYQTSCPPWCLKDPEDPCGVIANFALYDYDGNCPFTDPETGDQIPGRDCRYNFVFDWTFTEPCTGGCTCVTCCGNGTIRIDGQNYPSGTTQGISIWAALTCGSGAQQLFFPVQCVGNMQTTTMLNPGYNVTCGSCN